MSNVFSNSSFAVLSVMKATDDDNYLGSTVYLQRKPEENYGNITILSYAQSGYGSKHNLIESDFDDQTAFEANVVPALHSAITNMSAGNVVIANSNISVKSYSSNGTEITD